MPVTEPSLLPEPSPSIPLLHQLLQHRRTSPSLVLLLHHSHPHSIIQIMRPGPVRSAARSTVSSPVHTRLAADPIPRPGLSPMPVTEPSLLPEPSPSIPLLHQLLQHRRTSPSLVLLLHHSHPHSIIQIMRPGPVRSAARSTVSSPVHTRLAADPIPRPGLSPMPVTEPSLLPEPSPSIPLLHQLLQHRRTSPSLVLLLHHSHPHSIIQIMRPGPVRSAARSTVSSPVHTRLAADPIPRPGLSPMPVTEPSLLPEPSPSIPLPHQLLRSHGPSP